MSIQNGIEVVNVVATTKIGYQVERNKNVNAKLEELSRQGKEVVDIKDSIPMPVLLNFVGTVTITWKKDDAVKSNQGQVNSYVQKSVMVNSENFNSIMKRIEIFLGDSEWDKADSYCEAVLDYDPECAMAYVYKLLAKYKSTDISWLTYSEKIGNKEFYSDDNYRKAIKYADTALRKRLELYENKKRKNETETAERAKAKENEEIYQKAMHLKDFASQLDNDADLLEAKKLFESIPNYKDSDQKYKLLEEKIYQKAMHIKDVALLSNKYSDLYEAKKLFESISKYKDSEQQFEILEERIQRIYDRDDKIKKLFL
jgi:hypothetical protein